MAKDFLLTRFDIPNIDMAAKPQGAPGLDVDVVTRHGERIVAEIKTTVPYQPGLGAKQKEMWMKDFRKLAAADAAHKFFFVTDPTALAVARTRFAPLAPGVLCVLLPCEGR